MYHDENFIIINMHKVFHQFMPLENFLGNSLKLQPIPKLFQLELTTTVDNNQLDMVINDDIILIYYLVIF